MCLCTVIYQKVPVTVEAVQFGLFERRYRPRCHKGTMRLFGWCFGHDSCFPSPCWVKTERWLLVISCTTKSCYLSMWLRIAILKCAKTLHPYHTVYAPCWITFAMYMYAQLVYLPKQLVFYIPLSWNIAHNKQIFKVLVWLPKNWCGQL